MFDIDIIIPCYGPSEIIDKGVASIAHSWKSEYAHVTLVDDCSPNTKNHYQDLIDKYKSILDIRCIVMPENSGQGLTRQFGIDNTSRPYFMFMDEDDKFSELAISTFVGVKESHDAMKTEDGQSIIVDRFGDPVPDPNLKKKVAIISGPLFEWDDNHTHVIPSYNHVWLNSKLYSREFIEKHNIRFNKAQSRHAEDYFFTSCFFYALEFDDEYEGLVLNDEEKLYYWYPNTNSQSRVDPHYGHMLAGYTMDGSCNILKWMRETDIHGIPFEGVQKEHYYRSLLNMTIYSWFNYLSFIREVSTTDYIPKLEMDWILVRDSCNTLRKWLKENWDRYRYIQIIEEIYVVKNQSDVSYTEPWMTFEDYVMNGHEGFDWDFSELIYNAKRIIIFEDNLWYVDPCKDEEKYRALLKVRAKAMDDFIDYIHFKARGQRAKQKRKQKIAKMRRVC